MPPNRTAPSTRAATDAIAQRSARAAQALQLADGRADALPQQGAVLLVVLAMVARPRIHDPGGRLAEMVEHVLRDGDDVRKLGHAAMMVVARSPTVDPC